VAAVSKSPEEYIAYIARQSPFSVAASRWVANYNTTLESGITQVIDEEGNLNPLTNSFQITDVNFASDVGSYYYTERTYCHGYLGLMYTFWERRIVAKGKNKGQVRYYQCLGHGIQWWQGMSAGQFIEEAVGYLT
jgi:hypothetical protein